MELGNAALPLLSLPDTVITSIIGQMEPASQVWLSLLSTRARSAVRSVGMTTSSLNVLLERAFQFELVAPEESNQEPIVIGLHHTEEDEVSRVTMELADWGEAATATVANFKMSIRDWIQHMTFILNHGGIDELKLTGESEDFGVERLRKSVKDLAIKTMTLTATCTGKHAKEVIPKIVTPHINVDSALVMESDTMAMIMMNNFTSIIVGGPSMPGMTIRRDLIAESQVGSLDARCVNFDSKAINRYLKQWRAGNILNLHHLSITIGNGVQHDADAVLWKLPHQMMPMESITRFPHSAFAEEIVINGGCIIKKSDIRDREQAIIIFTAIEEGTRFEMFVI
ncbi:hypothetical protein GCK72_008287 [Caenorhabditis remanei]|uniref:F-box domain-containing protein n=1 Tax=Caenorhabditis remanei TaxID=31234 RepID=A0A6A5GZ94_CAERE|nr:hypothetical protein GCK72_008287 [Caenorhabditis remanei]KAF1760041.1 hypothetical protein GCK72_008287 [Caenorhabditis remanei]